MLSHHTAAQLRGLPVPETDQVHVSTPPGVRAPRIAGVRAHERSPATVLRSGRRISAAVDNFVELAEMLCLVDLVVLGDAMVRRGFLTCEGLLVGVASAGPRRGVRMARRAAELVRAGVESPMETRLRLLVVLAGLPEPAPGHTVRDAIGGWIGEVDTGLPRRSDRDRVPRRRPPDEAAEMAVRHREGGAAAHLGLGGDRDHGRGLGGPTRTHLGPGAAGARRSGAPRDPERPSPGVACPPAAAVGTSTRRTTTSGSRGGREVNDSWRLEGAGNGRRGVGTTSGPRRFSRSSGPRCRRRR